jgi:hypothetical protein
MKAIRAGLFVGIAGAFIVFALAMALRLGEAWSTRHTDLFLGGLLVILGGSLILLAAFIGAGAFARLAGWHPPRQPQEPPIETSWRELPPGAPTQALPPWGLTGGGQYELLPPLAQDRRYSLDAREPRDVRQRDG